MSFDFTTYQAQALTTALPSALTMDYLAPGRIAELDELESEGMVAPPTSAW